MGKIALTMGLNRGDYILDNTLTEAEENTELEESNSLPTFSM